MTITVIGLINFALRAAVRRIYGAWSTPTAAIRTYISVHPLPSHRHVLAPLERKLNAMFFIFFFGRLVNLRMGVKKKEAFN